MVAGFARKTVGKRAESRIAPEALTERAWGVRKQSRARRLWRRPGGRAAEKEGRGARRLGRGCEVSARDSFKQRMECGDHLKASSSRK